MRHHAAERPRVQAVRPPRRGAGGGEARVAKRATGSSAARRGSRRITSSRLPSARGISSSSRCSDGTHSTCSHGTTKSANSGVTPIASSSIAFHAASAAASVAVSVLFVVAPPVPVPVRTDDGSRVSGPPPVATPPGACASRPSPPRAAPPPAGPAARRQRRRRPPRRPLHRQGMAIGHLLPTERRQRQHHETGNWKPTAPRHSAHNSAFHSVTIGSLPQVR